MKRGRSAKTRYTVTVAKGEAGGDVRIHVQDYEFLEMEGRKADDPALAPVLAVALPMAKIFPDLVVGPDGRVKDVVGLDAAIENVLSELEKSGDENVRKAAPPLRTQLTSPQARPLLTAESKTYWEVWVGAWTAVTLAEGGTDRTTRTVSGPDGSPIEAPTTIRRMRAPEDAGCTRLLIETLLDGDLAKQALDAWVKRMTAASGKAPPAPDYFQGFRQANRLLVVTDPATMRPRRAVREDSRTLAIKDEGDRTDIERHDYSFEWAPAEAGK
jgi:hypothetical protein